MARPIRAVLIGAGNRGAEAYGPYALRYPEQLGFVAVAEPKSDRRARFAAQHSIPPENQFPSWEPLLAGPRMGQGALICTQDQQHTAPALAALRAGYDVLLEKPMATTVEECRQLVAAASETGRQLHLCHILRHTRHFRKLRDIVRSGVLGQLMHVAQCENVSWWHMAHSYVRGQWRSSAESCPMILAKCCHDFDILIWTLARRCEALCSVGDLLHFRPENAPDGAPPRCLDGCPASESCPYYAPFIYQDLVPLWRSFSEGAAGLPRLAAQVQQRSPAMIRTLSAIVPPLRRISHYQGWPRSVVSHEAGDEQLLQALRDGPYGRCVFHCDNDVVDHQVVLMRFEGGLSATLTMQGHAHTEHRTTRIEGSRATLQAYFGLGGSWIEVNEHRSDRRARYNTSAPGSEGHGGGDRALMAAFVRSLQQGRADGPTLARHALESHLMAFAAERARKEGLLVRM